VERYNLIRAEIVGNEIEIEGINEEARGELMTMFEFYQAQASKAKSKPASPSRIVAQAVPKSIQKVAQPPSRPAEDVDRRGRQPRTDGKQDYGKQDYPKQQLSAKQLGQRPDTYKPEADTCSPQEHSPVEGGDGDNSIQEDDRRTYSKQDDRRTYSRQEDDRRTYSRQEDDRRNNSKQDYRDDSRKNDDRRNYYRDHQEDRRQNSARDDRDNHLITEDTRTDVARLAARPKPKPKPMSTRPNMAAPPLPPSKREVLPPPNLESVRRIATWNTAAQEGNLPSTMTLGNYYEG